MTHTPLISIISATYNAEKYLQTSINSILLQTYKNFEYIVIDGGSKDYTRKIILNNKGSIAYWISERDSGIYDAWNKGLTQARGEWIVFLGADDQLLPDALQNYVDFINNNSKLDFDYISSRVKRILPNGTVEGIVGKPWIWKEFKFRMTVAHPGSFHSRKLFEKYGNYNTNFKIVSDYEILLRPKSELKAGYINKITVLMSTGGKFDAFNATKEVISMFKTSNHLSTVQYYVHKYNLYLRFFIGNLLTKIL